MFRRSATLAALLLLVSSTALAQITVQTKGPEQWPGKNEVSTHIGFQNGLVGNTPTGFKLFLDYSLRVNNFGNYSLWLNAGVDLALSTTGGCNGFATAYYCYSNGNTVEPHVGVKVKYKTPIPLVPYVMGDAEFIGIYGRTCGDNGFAITARVGTGAKYFLTKHIGLGIEFGFALGPEIDGGTSSPFSCSGFISNTPLYAAFDVGLGGEFIF